ncbi:MAG TPA: hypothetical protein VLN61_10385 [Pseudolabrys sp.]|nr:hypothetical protein [Pseudolabrys sp.]
MKFQWNFKRNNYSAEYFGAGGGVEYMLARNWTVRAEALYADFGSKTITVVSPPIGFIGNYSSTFRHAVSTARDALNWKW